MLPYAYFECFKSVMDGTERRALTTEIVITSLVVFVGCYLILSNIGWPKAELPCFLVAFATLGGISLVYTKRVVDKGTVPTAE